MSEHSAKLKSRADLINLARGIASAQKISHPSAPIRFLTLDTTQTSYLAGESPAKGSPAKHFPQ